ncbi:MAG TPA: transcriptional regulator, partial [Thalassospira lucentensis]|nr:transcriptional regulator [Thalassospira lucentensis]
MKECSIEKFSADCPSRLLFDQIADKWSMMILAVLAKEPL